MEALLPRILLIVFGGMTFIVLFSVLFYGAFLWITSGGEKEKIEQAQLVITIPIVSEIVIVIITGFTVTVEVFFGISGQFSVLILVIVTVIILIVNIIFFVRIDRKRKISRENWLKRKIVESEKVFFQDIESKFLETKDGRHDA